MIREYFDTSRNTQAEYIDFLWERHSELLQRLSIEKNSQKHEALLDEIDHLYHVQINTAYSDHYTIHGYHYSEQPSLPHLSN